MNDGYIAQHSGGVGRGVSGGGGGGEREQGIHIYTISSELVFPD